MIALVTFVLIVLYPPMTLEHVDCLKDSIQDSLGSHYEYFAQNPVMKNQLLIGFGALTDILLLVFMARWSYFGGTWRLMIALFLTYALRLFFTSLFKMSQPEGGDLWDFPGFYSLTVQYGSCNDYYFNPVVALTTQLFFEYRAQN